MPKMERIDQDQRKVYLIMVLMTSENSFGIVVAHTEWIKMKKLWERKYPNIPYPVPEPILPTLHQRKQNEI